MPTHDTPDLHGPDQATIEHVAPLPAESHETELPACVDLVQGPCGGLSQEMQTVLRSRLRTAAVVLAVGFALFLVWSLIELTIGSYRDLPTILHLAAVTAIVGLCGGLLCRTCPLDARKLHLYELAIFGMPVAFFIHVQASEVGSLAAQQLPLPDFASLWLLLVFTHALFIPNTWRRAAAFLGPIAVAPLVTILALWLLNADVRRALSQDPQYLIHLTLVMLIGYGSALVGVHTIGALRREAFTARQLGQYRLQRLLGAGGMGEVFLAEHQLLKRPCAIKVIRPEKAGDAKVLKRFEREVRATATLSHWNSVAVYDYGHTRDGTFYYVMEYLPGLNLGDVVQRHGPLPASRAICVLRQACEALAEAHAKGIIHRDIKPANLFLAERGGVHDVVKVLDFGLAKPLAGAALQGLMDEGGITQEGAIAGSPYYMSPEQALGEPHLDPRSDIYSLGVVAYFLLTGIPPFQGSTAIKVLFAHAHETPVPPSEHANVPQDLEQVILRCLAKQPEDRFPDAPALAEALGTCAAADGWRTRDAAEWWRTHAASPPAEFPDASPQSSK